MAFDLSHEILDLNSPTGFLQFPGDNVSNPIDLAAEDDLNLDFDEHLVPQLPEDQIPVIWHPAGPIVRFLEGTVDNENLKRKKYKEPSAGNPTKRQRPDRVIGGIVE